MSSPGSNSTASSISTQSNKFRWSTHAVPRASWATDEDEDRADPQSTPSESFVIRSLKQGTTGAVKTWPVCDVLLDYLVRYGGLRDVNDKITSADEATTCSSDSTIGGPDVLDLTLPPSPSLQNLKPTDGSTFNIVELGAGTGCLGVGLAMSLNREDDDIDANTCDRKCLEYSVPTHSKSNEHRRNVPFRPTANVMCTDNDRATMKNMKYNISEQPRENNINRAVRIETLGWGDDIGGEKFSKAVGLQFRRKSCTEMHPDADPIRLATHLVASDVHYGMTTLDPLSSVISAFKLRNPDVIVVVLIKERNAKAFKGAAEIKSEIEAKVRCGMEMDHHDYSTRESELLQDFSVSVRDVRHRDITNMKMIEC